MLQCGGDNNTTSALLKQYFASEKATLLQHMSSTKAYQGSGGGILPCATPHTDLNSMKKAAHHHSTKGASALASPRSVPKPPVTKPLELSNASSTRSGASQVTPKHSKPSPRRESSPRSLAHGRTGPFGRRNVEKEFYDTVSTGHIPCLSHPST